MSTDPATRSVMNPGDWGLLAALSILWGATFVFAKVALPAIAPFTLVLGRVAIGAACLAVVLPLAGVSYPRGRAAWAALFCMGFLNNVVPFSLIFWGQSLLPRDVSASLSSILNAATPIFTVVVCHVLTDDEKLTGPKAAGVGLGFVGVATMVSPALAGAGLEGASTLAGVACCLGACLVYAFSGVFGRRFKRMGVSPLQAAFGQLAASSLLMAPVSALVDRPWTRPWPGVEPLAALVALGVLSTALAYVLFFALLARAGATNLQLVTLLIPVSAVFLGVGFLGEHLGTAHVVGMALIASGLVAIDGRLVSRRAGRPRTA